MNYSYSDGRFFISPLIGCKSSCVYCYLTKELHEPKIIRKNKIHIEEMIECILNDSNFKQGKNGSIISIGAYCDIFPISEMELIEFSIDWIINLLKVGNPVQIISKNKISENLIKKICADVKYPGQLLYSTTITSFNYWNVLENNTNSPYERLETLKLFKDNGVNTNIMIKPFLPGITELDIEIFIKELKKDFIDYCVVGDLYLIHNNILNVLDSIKFNEKKSNIINDGSLECMSDRKFKIIVDDRMDQFINSIRNNNILVFKKSSCINANILKVNNISEYYKENPKKYCINCKNCEYSILQ